MPNFPTYYGAPPPKVLNPLNLAHYWLVFKWVFFQPSRLKHYLYQIDPELYHAHGFRALGRTVCLPAYQYLYQVFLIASFLIAASVAWGAFGVQATSGGWSPLLLAWALGVVLGVTLSVSWNVAGSGALVVAMIAALGAVLSVSVDLPWSIIWLVFLLIISASGVRWGEWLTTELIMTLSAAGSVALVVALIAALGKAVGSTGGVPFGVAVGMALPIGASRLIFYPFELLWVGLLRLTPHRQLSLLKYHPVLWDELAWPLPSFDAWIRQQLNDNFENALRVTVVVASNPFQRWIAQRTLTDWLASQRDALTALQRIALWPPLDERLASSRLFRQYDELPTARVVLLGEVGQCFVDATAGISATSERTVWRLTRSLRRMQSTPLSQFSAMFYELLRDETKIEKQSSADIQLAQRFHVTYEAVRVYPHGDEVANSWASLAAFLEATTFKHIGAAHEQLAWILHIEQPYLAPEVIGALTALGDVSRSVVACLQATSLPNKTVALNQAAGGLHELVGYVEKELWPPKKVLYLALIKNWQSLIATEQGRLGESALRQMSPSERLATGLVDRTSDVWQHPAKPLVNPYIAGDPVMPPLFVGRRDIFTRINEIWRAKANPDSIILYGHRRMGKSSILRNLDQAAPGRIIAYVNLQGETSLVESTADLLLVLADCICREVKRGQPDVTLAQPLSEQFATPVLAQLHFNRFMEGVRAALSETGLILALDEFEAIEEAVRDGKVGKEIYQFLRAKTQEPWITVVFGGLHTLDEMSRDYAQPFYGSYQNIVVSYLAPEDAYHLITNPTPDFTVNYEPAAVERILAATGGQPYLVQLVCRDALDHLNHELFDEHKEREVKLTLVDVEAVLGDDLFRRGTGYFDGVWTQVSEAAQQDLLRCMARREEAWTLAELQEATHLTPDELRQHLQLAQRRDILRQRDSAPDGDWEFCVPLMRQWIVWKE